MRLHVKLKEFFLDVFYSHIIFPCIQCFFIFYLN